MILKIRTNKRDKFGYVLRYMLEDKNRLYDNGGKPFVITHNMKGRGIDIASWTNQFKENENLRTRKRRKDGIILYHEILSFNSLDSKNLSSEKIENMIRTYIRLRNPNASYVVCVHKDREHIHAHICTSAIDRSGKNMRLSRKELADLKKNIQEYQISKYPELSHSVVRHGRKDKRISEKEQQLKRRTGKTSQRETVQAIVESCRRKSKSQEEFYTKLKEQELETYVRGGKVYGVQYAGRKFRFKTFEAGFQPLARQIGSDKELNRIRKSTARNRRDQSRQR